MQNLAQIIDANGIQVERVPIEGTRQVPSEPNEYQNGTYEVPFSEPELEAVPLSRIDDTRGRYTAKALADEFGLSSAGLRNVWFPHLLGAVGGDRNSQRLRRGKFTELAAHLFRLYSRRPDSQTADDWIVHIQSRLAAEDEPVIEVEEIEVTGSELVLNSEAFYESQADFLDRELDESRGRSQLMLRKMQALQRQDEDYGEISHTQQVQAAREIGYERRLELLLAKKEGERQAEKDVLGNPKREVPASEQHFQRQK